MLIILLCLYLLPWSLKMTLIGFAKSGSPTRPLTNLANSLVTIIDNFEYGSNHEVAVGDLSENDHAVFQASSRIFTSHSFSVRCRLSLLLVEPRVIQRRFYSSMRFLAPRFYRVFSHYPPLVASIPNARLIYHGGSWLESSFTPQLERSSLCSLIASTKQSTEGQRLRHSIANWAKDSEIELCLLGRGYHGFDVRSDGFIPFCYSVVIENSRESGYFTEKLIDCLLCETVPIYWGDPDIAEHFDMGGIIACRNSEDIKQAILTISKEDYHSRRDSLSRNARTALKYVDRRIDVARILRAEA